jgi:hypothetical protein
VEQQEVHNEEINVGIIEAVEDRYGDQSLTAEEIDPGQWWILQKVAHNMKMDDTNAILELHKRCICKRPGKASVVRKAPEGRLHEKRRWMHQECNNGI